MTALRTLPFALLLAFSAHANADDLLQIYHEARASDPAYAAAEANKLANDEYVNQARAQLLPQIGISIDYSRSTRDDSFRLVSPVSPESGAPVSIRRSTGGQISQSILDISRWTALKATRYSARAGAATLDAATQQLYVRVAQAYFNVLTALDALRFAKSNEIALGRQLEQANQRFEVGLSAITDVNDSKAQHDNAVANVIRSQNAVDNAREAVRQLTNKAPGEFKQLRDELPLERPVPDDPEAWVGVALQNNPALSAAALQVDAANANVNTARAGHLPTLDGSIGYSNVDTWGRNLPAAGLVAGTGWGSSIGVTLRVPIFSGGYTQSRVRQAIHNRDYAEDIREQNRRGVEAATRNGYRAVIAGAAEIEATRAAVVSAQSSVEATQAGYEVGTRTIVDVLISQQTLLQAQSNYSAARHNYVLNRLYLKQAAGVLEVKDLEAINALLVDPPPEPKPMATPATTESATPAEPERPVRKRVRRRQH